MFATKARAGQNKIVCPCSGTCTFSASNGLRKGSEAEGIKAAADGRDCEKNFLPVPADQVGGVPGIAWEVKQTLRSHVFGVHV